MARNVHQSMKRALKDECACYVLITCRNPSPEGKMDVEMTWHGDPYLAHALLQDAQGIVETDSELNEEEG